MRILFLQKRLLFPADTGGKIRTLNVVRHLAKWHELTFLCNVLPEEQPHLDEMRNLGVRLVAIPWNETTRHSIAFYSKFALNLLSRYPYSVNKDFDRRVQASVDALLRDGIDLIVCDFVQMARNIQHIQNVPMLLFQHNVEAQIYRRMANNEPHRAKRWMIRNQQYKMQAFENAAGRWFHRVIAVSKQDRDTFACDYGWRHVDVIDTAVDTEYFRPREQGRTAGKLVFVGSMDWPPNQDGVRRFVHNVLPRIQQRLPHVTLDIVGRNPPSAIRRLDRCAGVTVTGSVADVRPYIAQAQVAVVPIYAGGGTRLKIFEFMAMRTPVVSTTIGAEGLDIEDRLHWIRADSDRQFADAVCELIGDDRRCERLSEAAYHRVREHYSSEVVARQFEAICLATGEQRFPA